MQAFLALLPEGISLLSAATLIAASFFTAALTAAFGIGGGVALLAIMASIVPVAVLIPVHGVVQLGANASRAMVQIRHAVWSLLAIFTAGAVLGALIGGQLVVTLPETLLKTFVGLFVLFTLWGPKIGGSNQSPFGLFIGGVMATILTMFVGATGPFVAALLAPRLGNRLHYNGTHATAMVLQHGLKVAAFGFLGFAFGAWVPLIAAMVGAAFLGTILGNRFMNALPEETFRKGFKAILTLLAIQLIASAAWSSWA